MSLKYLSYTVRTYKEVVKKNTAYRKTAKPDTMNKSVKKLFREAKNDSAITSNLYETK